MLVAKIIGGDGHTEPDSLDAEILITRVRAFDDRKGPRVGDYIRFSDGVTHRFSHAWPDGIQTSPGGSFYLGEGYVSFSGGLDPIVRTEKIEATEEKRAGGFWFFHRDWWQAHSGVHAQVECRVFATALASDHWRRRGTDTR